MDPEERFAALADAFVDRPGVLPPEAPGGRRFGASALTVDGSIFAMLTGGRLVLKLPAERVAGLVADGTGAAFIGSGGRAMRQWVTVLAEDDATWRELAEEALRHVSS